jgi:hypothetical protein
MALLLAVCAAVLPGVAGRAAGWAMVGALVGAPVLRVARLTWTWARTGDRRHALLGAALLLVVLAGAVGAALAA